MIVISVAEALQTMSPIVIKIPAVNALERGLKSGTKTLMMMSSEIPRPQFRLVYSPLDMSIISMTQNQSARRITQMSVVSALEMDQHVAVCAPVHLMVMVPVMMVGLTRASRRVCMGRIAVTVAFDPKVI